MYCRYQYPVLKIAPDTFAGTRCPRRASVIFKRDKVIRKIVCVEAIVVIRVIAEVRYSIAKNYAYDKRLLRLI